MVFIVNNNSEDKKRRGLNAVTPLDTVMQSRSRYQPKENK